MKREKGKLYTLNEESQRITRRERTFHSCQYLKKKKKEEINTMGKSTDLFKEIRDTMGKCHAKRETVKERNCTDLTEAEDIKRCERNTQINYAQKIL